MHATFHDPDDGGWPGHDTITDRCHDCRLAAENVLAAVSPVIRRQVAEEIAKAIDDRRDRALQDLVSDSPADTKAYWQWRKTLDGAAAIARTHAPEEGKP